MAVYFHIGLHKTGSTFLQKKVFPHLKDCFSVSYFSNKKYFKEVENLQKFNPLNFKKKKIDNLLKLKNKKKNILLSSEQFSGSGNFSQIAALNNFYNNFFFIKKFFPKAKIILIIRNQKDIINSYYKDEVSRGLTLNFEKWVGNNIKNNSLNYFKYDILVSFLFKQFGKNNVIVGFFEEIFEDKFSVLKFFEKIFKKKFYKKINMSRSNPGIADQLIFLNRFINHFMKTKLNTETFTGKYDYLKLHQFFRYKIFPILTRFCSQKSKKFDINKFTKLKYDFTISNKKLEILLKKKLPKEYYIT
jgi:hypothetical protein